MKTILWCKKC